MSAPTGRAAGAVGREPGLPAAGRAHGAGRAKNVSPEILAAIAHVLKLDEAQCLYVMQLAGHAAPRRPQVPAEGVQRLNARIVEGFMPNPAYVIDRYWDIKAANQAAVHLLGMEGARRNYLEMLFLEPQVRARFPCWERDAAEAVARFRAQSGEFLGDPRLAAQIGYLCEYSPAFTALWAQHQIGDGSSYDQVLRHPTLGQVSLTQVGLDLCSCPGLRLILLSPGSDGTADRISTWADEFPRTFDVAGTTR